jgi:putative mRNA 3-end processing factor
VARFNEAYREAGIALPTTLPADAENAKATRGRALVIAPESAAGSGAWLRKFGPASTAIASGWMRIRGPRRRRSVDRGFVLSDHADWPGLIETIRATGARRILVTHGHTEALTRWLNENGWDANVISTHFRGESADVVDAEESQLFAPEGDHVAADGDEGRT